MRVLFLLFILSIARSPSYQKCISALANFDGFNGSEIIVTFPEGYSEVELKETVENLGHLVISVTYTSDIRNREKEVIMKGKKRNYMRKLILKKQNVTK